MPARALVLIGFSPYIGEHSSQFLQGFAQSMQLLER
jgi:hypothetical protein